MSEEHFRPMVHVLARLTLAVQWNETKPYHLGSLKELRVQMTPSDCVLYNIIRI